MLTYGPLTVGTTESVILTAVRRVLLDWLPDGIEVFKAQGNRVPEPVGPDFVVMTPLRRTRLGQNIVRYRDVMLIGAIAGTLFTVSGITLPAGATDVLRVGSTLFGQNVTPRTRITAFLGGSGGVGDYTVMPSQTLASGPISTGMVDSMMETKFTLQLDVHGPGASDLAQGIATEWRDLVGWYDLQPFAPLDAQDPRQVPFTNAEDQWEYRWVVELDLQANIITSASQQFFDNVTVQPIAVDLGIELI